MSKFKRTLAMLIAVVMVICALPMTVAAETEAGDKNAIKVSKSYNQGTGKLTLEAYVTGETQTVVTTQPIDVVLVLDVSGSMKNTFGGNTTVYEEAYDIRSDRTYYYIDADGNYREAFFCGYYTDEHDRNTWWTEEHYDYWIFGGDHGGTQLFPKTSQDSSGTQFYTLRRYTPTKLDALKTAAIDFIRIVAGNTDDNSISNIAIVKFAGENSDEIGDDKYNNNSYNYSQTVMGLTRADSGQDDLIAAVNRLTHGGATRADLGLKHAQNILSTAETEGRKQVVVMFTDGSPTNKNGFNDNTADAAAAVSAAMNYRLL